MLLTRGIQPLALRAKVINGMTLFKIAPGDFSQPLGEIFQIFSNCRRRLVASVFEATEHAACSFTVATPPSAVVDDAVGGGALTRG